MRNDGYNGTAHVNAAAVGAGDADSRQNARLPMATLQFAHVAAATDAQNPARNDDSTLAAAVRDDFCCGKRWNGGHCACGARNNLAVEVNDEKSKWLRSIMRRECWCFRDK